MYGRNMSKGKEASCGQKMRRLAVRLELTDEQLAMIAERFPEFELNCQSYCGGLSQKRAELLALFEEQDSTDEQIKEPIENLTRIHSRLEKSIIECLIVLRPTLTDHQRELLRSLY